MRCPICHVGNNNKWDVVEGVAYFLCQTCGSIYADPDLLNDIDCGLNTRQYDESYWANELSSAKQRSWGSSIARVAESILYNRIPINTYLDIGTGPGFLLDAVAYYFPSNVNRFHGVESYPPVEKTNNPNYFKCSIGELPCKYDGGSCIEVVEHLTPIMCKNLFCELERVSNPGALYIFNTGMPEYVLNEDRRYMDPHVRGHIMSYSLDAIKILSAPFNFTPLKIPGKTWAYILEYKPRDRLGLDHRIWAPIEENLKILNDPQTGAVMHVLALESARAYL
jgi:hypothetical protein